MFNKSNTNIFYLFTALLIILSYFLGFYFDEDAAGGGKVDFLSHEWGNINLFANSEILAALTDSGLKTGRMPLYLIMAAYIVADLNYRSRKFLWQIFDRK